LFMEGRPVQFINGMTRDRRRLQMLWKYEAKPKVKEIRQKHSKYRKSEHKATKSEISKISLSKTFE
jgi:hypothetical protein